MKILCILFSSMLLLTGCLETKYLEKLGLITAVGYDKAEDDKLKGTTVLYQFNPSMDEVEKTLTTTARTSKGIRLSQNLDTDHKLVSGQLRVAVYGKDIAEEGIAHLVDTLERDSSIGNMVYLAVAESTAEEILTFPLKEEPSNTGTYLYNLIQQNVDGDAIIAPTLQEFVTDYGSVGKDAILPMLSITNGDMGVEGFALFDEDRYVQSVGKERFFYVRSLIENNEVGSVELGVPLEAFKEHLSKWDREDRTEEDLFITLDSIRSSFKIRLPDRDQPNFHITLKVKSRLLEMSEELHLGNPKVIKLLERSIDKKMEESIEDVLTFLQENHTDPVGFGMKYMSVRGHQDLTRKQWTDLYQKATFHVTVENEIVRTGVIN
ncbi:Ger(x)C family spore germination protein [Rossellomorea marisflavi]|uniref:Ger(X)C family spore germination protein n=1 Tax=Rossellomorea marisflavi TaxID=189381 RepID=A0A5D4RZZ2_9BACI|nr:Ger(x)C family spore germination protein [Rossellomorea marisflavi]TYS56249.1 Ger(x)C family spore germination protein [Rossellomorea marisflavi]